MDRRIIIAIAAVALILLVSGIAVLALSGDDKPKPKQVPGLETFPDLSLNLATSDIMVNDGQTIYFPIAGNGTEVVLVSSIVISIRWADDEQPPIYRPMYNNEPDLFRASIMMPNSDGNGTSNTTANSDSGSLNLNLAPFGNPGAVMGNGQPNWTFPATGAAELAANDTFYISVQCNAGDIRSTNPRLLLYNDPGDEIDMTVTLKYKSVPLYVYEYWFLGEGRGM